LEGHLKMSKKERDRLIAMERVKSGALKLKDASRVIQLGYRQTKRVWRRYKEDGARGLVHRSRGKISNNRIEEKQKEKVLNLYSTRYKDFGPLFASEKMLEEYKLKVNDETLRLWLMRNGLWSKKRDRKKHRKYRERRHHFGELVQMDGSFHKWFNKEEEEYCLMNMVDDATGKTFAKFDKEETTAAAMKTLWGWIDRYGIPEALYVDYRNVYISPRGPNIEETLNGEIPDTHFSRACKKLGIEIIGANSPQAKGRVERKNGVHQDRLIKELKLKEINEIKKANKFLENKYLDVINNKFQVKPLSAVDFHRSVPCDLDLRTVFYFEEERYLNNDWTIRYKNIFYQIEKQNDILPMPKTKLKIAEWLDGTIHIMHRGVELKFKKLKSKPEKEIKQTELKPKKKYIPPPDHPWKRWWGYKKWPQRVGAGYPLR
jgi:hypothetical protein